MAAGDIVPAVVTRRRTKSRGSRRPSCASAGLRRDHQGRLRVDAQDDARLPARRRPRRRAADEGGRRDGGRDRDLEQTPIIEGALLAIDNRTGQIRAMVGGFSFARSKFNRAVQAYRQLGSTFKPIVYTAAIDRGYTPASMLLDAPVAYPSGPASRSTRRRTTTARSRDRSRSGTRSNSRATCRPSPARRARPEGGHPYARVRVRGQPAALPVARARLGGGDAARRDECLHGLPEPGRAHAAVRRAEGARSRGQPARGGAPRAARRDPR